ncbi:hypothetical protein SRHO_G00242950 [Serrasalmus rhombeus]
MTHQLMLVHAMSQLRQKGPARVEHSILHSCGSAHIKVTYSCELDPSHSHSEGGLYWCSDFPGHLLPNFTSIFKPKHLSLQFNVGRSTAGLGHWALSHPAEGHANFRTTLKASQGQLLPVYGITILQPPELASPQNCKSVVPEEPLPYTTSTTLTSQH